jgi:aspartokinase
MSNKEIHVLSFEGPTVLDAQSLTQAIEYLSEYPKAIAVLSAFSNTHDKLLAIIDTAISGKMDAAHSICDEIYDLHYSLIREALDHHPNPKNTLILETTDKKLDDFSLRLKKLLSYAQQAKNKQDRWIDSILPIGDQIAAYVFSQAALSWGILTQYVEATKLIKTDNNYGQAIPNTMSVYQQCGSLETLIENGFTPILGGGYGKSQEGSLSRIGPDGLDMTARLIAGALEAKSIEFTG